MKIQASSHLLKMSIIFVSIIISFIFPKNAHAYPEIRNPVNDYAGIISQSNEYKITKLLTDHLKKTGVQMAVLTIGTTGRIPFEKYSMDIANKWGGGSRERDDGILFLIAVKDRKMRLELGDGIYGYISESKALEILQSIRPDFKRSAYGTGIIKAVKKVIDETSGIKAGESLSIGRKTVGLFFRLNQIHWVFFLFSVLIGIIFVVMRQQVKKQPIISRSLAFILFITAPVLLQLFYPGVWFWRPIIYFCGLISGTTITGYFFNNYKLVGKIVFAIISLAFTTGSFLAIYFYLDVQKPNPFGTSSNETYALAILLNVNIFQSVALFFALFDMTSPGGGRSYNSHSSTYYNSSSSSSSSSSIGSSSFGSSSSSYSGGGGSFSGGGASSSW